LVTTLTHFEIPKAYIRRFASGANFSLKASSSRTTRVQKEQAMQHSKKELQRRGWPVVATGTKAIGDSVAYRRWRESLKLPEESPDFSDQDAFDLLEYFTNKRSGGEAIRIMHNDYPKANTIFPECA
jgi:hypothetical protein